MLAKETSFLFVVLVLWLDDQCFGLDGGNVAKPRSEEVFTVLVREPRRKSKEDEGCRFQVGSRRDRLLCDSVNATLSWLYEQAISDEDSNSSRSDTHAGKATKVRVVLVPRPDSGCVIPVSALPAHVFNLSNVSFEVDQRSTFCRHAVWKISWELKQYAIYVKFSSSIAFKNIHFQILRGPSSIILNSLNVKIFAKVFRSSDISFRDCVFQFSPGRFALIVTISDRVTFHGCLFTTMQPGDRSSWLQRKNLEDDTLLTVRLLGPTRISMSSSEFHPAPISPPKGTPGPLLGCLSVLAEFHRRPVPGEAVIEIHDSKFLQTSCPGTAALSAEFQKSGRMLVRRCLFENNTASLGGAFSVSFDPTVGPHPATNTENGTLPIVRPKGRLRIEHCRFVKNRGRHGGGAIMVTIKGLSRQEDPLVIIRNGTFLGNKAFNEAGSIRSGAAVYLSVTGSGARAEQHVTKKDALQLDRTRNPLRLDMKLTDCTFSENTGIGAFYAEFAHALFEGKT